MASLSLDSIYLNGVLIGLCGILFHFCNSFIVSNVPLKLVLVTINFILFVSWFVLVVINYLNLKWVYFREFLQIGVFYGGTSMMYPIVYLYPSKIFPAEHRGAVNSLVITGSQLVAAFFPLIGSLGTLVGQDEMVGCTAIVLLSAPMSLLLRPITL